MSHLVAVYGSLRKGMGNFHFLSGSKFLAEAEVPGFKMFSLGGFPFVCHDEEWEGAPIKVEVYEVDDEVFLSLDRLEGYPNFYNRMQVDTGVGNAWMYYIEEGNEERYGVSPLVESGDWVEFKKERAA